jgi:hypothetical protein
MAASDVLLRLAVLMDNSKAIEGLDNLSTKAKESADKTAKAFDESTTKLGNAFSSLGNLAGNYGLPIQGMLDGIGQKLDDAKMKGQGFSGVMQSMSGTFLAAGAAGVVGLAGASVHLADGFENAKASLEAAVDSSGSSLPKWQNQINATTQQMANLGFNSTDVYSALSKGVISTQNVGESLKNMGLAADLARTKHVDLSTATDAVDRALTGNLKPLKQLGIDLPIAATNALKLQQAHDKVSTATQAASAFLAQHADAVNTNSKYHTQYEKLLGNVATAQQNAANAGQAHDKIVDALSKRLGGQASAYADTFSGKMAVTKANLENVGASIGTKLMPILATLAGWFSKFITFITTHKEVMIALGILFGVTLTGAFIAWTASIWASTAALLANPITWIVLGVVALIAGIILLATHWHQVWDDIKKITQDAWNFIYNNFIGPIVGAFKGAFDGVKRVFSDVIDWISNHWQLILEIITGPIGIAVAFIVNNWNAIVGFFQGAIGAIGSVFSSIGDAIVGAFKTAFNFVASIWNDTLGKISFSIPSWIPVIGGKSFSIPQIPEFKAMGGPVTAFSPYIVGEQGPELFVPSTSGSIIPNGQLAGMGHTINVYATTNANPNQVAMEVGWALRTMAP